MAGAPLVWSSCGLAESLDTFVHENQLNRFEAKHIQILYGCLEQELDTNKLDHWMKIYKDLQKYIFISLTDRNICDIAASIIKKFFENKGLSEEILPITKDLFLKIVSSVYQPDISADAKDNLLDLCQYLVREDEQFKEYVFQVVKTYSERNQAAFLRSNLVEFMNELARSRRIRKFGQTPVESLTL